MVNLTEYAESLYNQSSAHKLSETFEKERAEYYKTGNRQNFEKLYFERRDLLSSCAFLGLSDDKYIPKLEKVILKICDEYCWALPAHTDGTRDADEKTIDLFVAETAFCLAEISNLLGDKISFNVTERIKVEIEKRLVKNYKSQSFWWEDCKMNWAAVCGGFTGGTLLYLFPDEFKRQELRILNTMKCYLEGFSANGGCLEGADYWLYGFSAFTYFADLLHNFTNGETDLFENERARKAADFIEKIFLKGNSALSFSDSDENVKADLCLQHYLSRRYPESVSLLPENRMSIWGGNTKWPCLYRTLKWVDNRKEENEHLENHILDNQIIINKEAYSLAIKGGNNDEPHNHNDLGSFIFADKNGQVLCDLGAGRYTKDYFNENRYSVFCNSSLSHSVPIIDNKEQSAGKNYKVCLEIEDNTVITDLAGAYNIKSLKAFIRSFKFDEKAVIITDKLKSENEISVTERFVTLREPEINGNMIVLNGTSLIFDDRKVIPQVNINYHNPHQYDEKPIKVYCIDFKLKAKEAEITFEIKA